MSIFRSETMQYFKIVFPDSNGYSILSKLGELGKLHFVDRNPDLLSNQKPFSNILRKCSELEEMVQQIEVIMGESKIEIQRENNLEKFFSKLYDKMMRREGNPDNYL